MKAERIRTQQFVFAAVVGLIMSFVLPYAANAQMQTTTAITGTVTDPSGAEIPGASVTVENQATAAVFKTSTNSVGIYSFPSLLPGTYTITISKSGFETAVITDRQVLATQPATVDIALRIGATSDSVTVSARGAELLTTGDQAITGTITPKLVQNLPNSRQNLFNLLVLAPGVAPQEPSAYNGGLGISQTASAFNYVSVGNTYNSSGSFVGGNRDSASNVSVDGSNVQDPVYQQTPQMQSTDTIQELRVETANMSAQFGYGASGIDIITKSGSNEFHGDGYEYLRNNHLDANDFFSNLAGQPLPQYKQNQFGISVGGPIKRDRLFFFFNYEGLRAVQTQNVHASAVPPSYASGDFSVNANSTPQNPLAPIVIYNPYSYNAATGLRSPFPEDKIPSSLWDPVTAKFLQQWVLKANGMLNNIPVYVGTQSNSITSNQYTGRVDFMQSSSSTIYGRFTETPFTGVAGSIDPLGGTFNDWGSYNAVIHWIKSFSSNAVNHIFAGYNRPTWYLGRNLNVPNVSDQIGIKGTSNLPGGPDFAVSGYDMDASTVFVDRAVTNGYQLQDDLNWATGRHNVMAGFSAIERRFSYQTQADDKGVFNFTGAYTSACPVGNSGCEAARTTAGASEGGFAFADYLLGATSDGATNANLEILNAAPYAGHQLYTGAYVQDSWRISTKLTLNYGLRYEHWTPWLVPRNTTLTYNPNTGAPVYALQNPLDYLDARYCYGACAPLNPSVPRTAYRTGNKNFAPRIGLAYAVSDSTVFRASFGRYYDGNVNDNQLSNLQTGAAPFSLRYQQSVQTLTTPVPTYTVGTMFPNISPTSIPVAYANPVNTFRFVEPYLPTASVTQWSADIQQRIGKTWGLDVSYVGSHTIHEFQFIDVNAPALPQGSLANVPLQQRRPFPGWGQLGTWAPIGWGRYNGLIASLRNSNAWHGLTFLSNFSWSKNIVSSHWGYSDIGNQNFRAPYIWAGDYTADPPVRFVGGLSFELPFGRGKVYASSLNPVLDHIVSGWVLSSIATFAKGGWAPILNLGPDQTGTGENQMPNLVCNPNQVPGGRNRLEWWNPTCVVPAQYGTYGTATIAAFTTPGINNWDISFQKNTATGLPKESGQLQFRADLFNAFNHTQWAAPTEYISAGSGPTEGEITSARPARQIQLSLRYLF